MKTGLWTASFTWNSGLARIGGTLKGIAGAAEGAGSSSLRVIDHVFKIPPIGPPETDRQGPGCFVARAMTDRPSAVAAMV